MVDVSSATEGQHMLVVTENARAIVKEITDSSAAEINALRISTESALDASPSALAITAVNAPEAGDQTIEEAGATIHLDAAAAQELDDKVLDAAVDESGAVRFAVAPQA
jgi:Fe-S cluster assembly iron-binding protein IscA